MDALGQTFQNVRDLVLMSVQGMTCQQDHQLRHTLRKKNIRLQMVKNSLTRRVFGELAGDWFTRALAELLPEFDRGLRAGPTLAGDDQIPPDAPMGPPGGAFYLFPKAPRPGGTEFVEEALRQRLLLIPGGVFSKRRSSSRSLIGGDLNHEGH